MHGKLRVLVVGCGQMGASHARAYRTLDGFEIAGLVSRGPATRGRLNRSLGGGIAEFDDFETALAATGPDAVCIATYPDTHAEFCRSALQAGCHVFVEKPLATNVAAAGEVVDLARHNGRALVVGYILRVHPAWRRFIEAARALGKPLVMRMNLNQQSSGGTWATHRKLMDSMSPLVDCGVHYVDVMCQMTGSRPLSVHAIGARLSEEVAPGMVNYGQLHVRFEDGSVGWYEAGWGPMISETAFFVKDVMGPKGCISIAGDDAGESADLASHTRTRRLKVHSAELTPAGEFARADQWIDTGDEPDHDGLCRLEQELFHRAIAGEFDTREHLAAALDSLEIVLAADESIRNGRVVRLD
jgi:predicted dehydrogenase